MTITEALRISQKSGCDLTFTRTSGGGWIRWVDDCQYKLHGDDLVADDWELVVCGEPRPTYSRAYGGSD